jgi:hypothetical protein
MIIQIRLRAGAAIPGRVSNRCAAPHPTARHAGHEQSTTGAQACATSTPRSDTRKPCTGQNPGPESPTITPGAPNIWDSWATFTYNADTYTTLG